MTGLIDSTVTIQAFAHCQSGGAGDALGDQLRFGLRAETVEFGLGVGGGELQDSQSILAVSNVGEQRRVGGGHNYVAYIVQHALPVKQLMQLHLLGLPNVDYGKSLLRSSYVRVGACQIDLAGVLQRYAVPDHARMFGI